MHLLGEPSNIPLSQVSSHVEQVDNEFEHYRMEFETSKSVRKAFTRERKMIEGIFNGYTKASKRGVKIVPLRQFKWMMRDLSMIPHITTEYKCAQLYKYLDQSKPASIATAYPEEILTLDTFPSTLYIVFSLVLEEDTELAAKADFILKWIKE